MTAASQAFEFLGAGGLLVVESRAMARAVRQAHDRGQQAAGLRVWASARVLTLDDWLAALWSEWRMEQRDARTLLSDAQVVRAFEAIIEEACSAPLLNVRATAHAAVRSWRRLLDWRCDDATWTAATEEERGFEDWTRRYLERQERSGWIDRGQLSAILAPQLPQSIAGERIALLGFANPPPAITHLLEHLEAAGADVARIPAPKCAARCVKFAANDSTAELLAAARWARSRLSAKGDARLAIIVPDLAERRAAVRATFDYILDPGGLLPTTAERLPLYAMIGGDLLTEFAVVDAALKLLAVGDGTLGWTVAGELLRSPYLEGWVEEADARARLDRRLRRLGRVEWASADVIRLAREAGCVRLADSFARIVDELGERRARRRAGAWTGRIGAALRTAGWTTGRPLSSVEHQAARRFRELLSELAALDELLPQMDWRAVRRELQRLAGATRFQPETGDPPVRILDALEHPGPGHEGLWVTGLTAERWPPAAAPDPFLPLALQRSLAMPWASAANELERARQATDRLLAAAEEVVISWPVQIEDARAEPSPLVPTDLPGYAEPARELTYGEESYAARRTEEVEDPAPALAARAAILPGGARVVELQAKCPFRAFGELRLGARPLESPRPGIAPLVRGRIVHAVFERLWRALESQERLKSMLPDELAALIGTSVTGACAAAGLTEPRSLVALERQWLAKAATALLQVEMLRAPFRVSALEASERFCVGEATLVLKIDRIDRLEQGGEFILDYKTGRPSAGRWLGPKRDLPQLPLYAVARAAPPAGLAFVHVNLRDPGFLGLAVDAASAAGIREPRRPRDADGRVRSFAAQLADWRDWVTGLVADHVAGVARVDPVSDQTCSECALAALCRIGGEAPAQIGDVDDS